MKSQFKIQINQSGMSLVEVIIAMGLASILAMGFTNMISQSNKATKELEEKMGILQFEKDLIMITAGLNICEKAFVDFPANFTYQTALFPPSGAIDIPGLYLDSAGTRVFAIPNSSVSSNRSLKVDSIIIQSVQGTIPNLTADLYILFKEGTIARRPVSTKVSLAAVNNGSSITLTGCSVRNAGGGGVTPPANVDSQAICEGLGGFWTDPGAPRPAFCSFDSESLSWF